MRTPPVVIDVRGAPPKASGYQRLSEKEQEVVLAKTTWSDGVWTEEHQKAFETLKHQKAFETLKGALLCRPVLVLPRKDRHWRLATDASIVAMGAFP